MALESVLANPPPLVGTGGIESENVGENESNSHAEEEEDLEDGEILDEDDPEARSAPADSASQTDDVGTPNKGSDSPTSAREPHVSKKGNGLLPLPYPWPPTVEEEEQIRKKKKKKKRKHHETSEEGHEGEKKKKRKRREHHEALDDEEMIFVRGSSPPPAPHSLPKRSHHSPPPLPPLDMPYDSYGSYDSEGSGDEDGMHRRRPLEDRSHRMDHGNLSPTSQEMRRMRRERRKRRNPPSDSDEVCAFFLQGKCQKHLETAPKEILGHFPRLSREGASSLIQNQESKVRGEGPIRKIPSLFDIEVPPLEVLEKMGLKLPKKEVTKKKKIIMMDKEELSAIVKKDFSSSDEEKEEIEKKNLKKKEEREDTPPKTLQNSSDRKENEPRNDQGDSGTDSNDDQKIPKHLPKRQRELFMRIQQQQRDAASSEDNVKEEETEDKAAQDEDWYSSDEEGGGLLSDVLKNISKEPPTSTTNKYTVPIKPLTDAPSRAQYNPAIVIKPDPDAPSPAVYNPAIAIKPDHDAPSPAVYNPAIAIKPDPDTLQKGLLPLPNSQNSSVNAGAPRFNLADLSKISITPDIARALSVLQNTSNSTNSGNNGSSNENNVKREEKSASSSSYPADPRISRDPRFNSRDPRDPRNRTERSVPATRPSSDPRSRDPRTRPRDPRAGLGDVDSRTSAASPAMKDRDMRTVPSAEARRDLDLRMRIADIDFRPAFRDVDLRGETNIGDITTLMSSGLPFKPVPMHTPATEIYASLTSHPPMTWTLHRIQNCKPNYALIRQGVGNATAQADPRLRDHPKSPSITAGGSMSIPPSPRPLESPDPLSRQPKLRDPRGTPHYSPSPPRDSPMYSPRHQSATKPALYFQDAFAIDAMDINDPRQKSDPRHFKDPHQKQTPWRGGFRDPRYGAMEGSFTPRI